MSINILRIQIFFILFLSVFAANLRAGDGEKRSSSDDEELLIAYKKKLLRNALENAVFKQGNQVFENVISSKKDEAVFQVKKEYVFFILVCIALGLFSWKIYKQEVCCNTKTDSNIEGQLQEMQQQMEQQARMYEQERRQAQDLKRRDDAEIRDRELQQQAEQAQQREAMLVRAMEEQRVRMEQQRPHEANSQGIGLLQTGITAGGAIVGSAISTFIAKKMENNAEQNLRTRRNRI